MTGLSAHIADIARRILGEPNREYSSRTELRFGSRGSISVEIAGPKQGEWYDHENSIGGGPWEFVRLKGNVADDEISGWLERELGIKQPNGHDRSRPIVATYDYRDETGKLLFQVVRFNAPKDFRQRRPDGVGGWTWSTKGVRKVPYRLPELLAAPIDERVFIVEGEKDANRLAGLDLIATTNPGGAAKRKDDGTPGKSKWRREYNEFFAGRRVYILPDNDDAGRDHARSIAANLAPIARSVAIIELPGARKPKDDVSNWLDAGHTREELIALADSTIPVQPSVGEITQAEINAEQSRQQQALVVLIKKFNDQYAVVNEAGKVLIFEQCADPMLKRKVIVRFTFDNFRRLYQHERLTVTTTTTSAGKMVSTTKTMADWWLDHRERRQYPSGVVFDPTSKTPANYWNLWDGFAVVPAPGDWSLMQEHVRKVICAGDTEHYEYLLNLIARLFQYPAEPAEVAIVMRGDEGVGKGIFARFITRAFGQHGIQISSAAHLVGNFNAHLRDCVVLFADEAFFAGDKQHEGRLKALVTEELITIEAKYQNVVTVKNMLHLILASNADWVIPASLQARRWFMLDVPDTVRGNRKYFSNLYTQMEEGGLAAMIHDLLRRDITNFDPRAVPTTKALVEQQVHSLDSLHKWWLAVLERSFLYRSRHRVPILHEWSDFYTTELLWQSYAQWCDENRIYRRQSREDLGTFMAKIYQKSRPRSRHPLYEIDVIDVDPIEKRGNWLNEEAILWKEHQPGYLVGTLPEARVRFTEICDIPAEWDQDP